MNILSNILKVSQISHPGLFYRLIDKMFLLTKHSNSNRLIYSNIAEL